jgi:hypothetical protein
MFLNQAERIGSSSSRAHPGALAALADSASQSAAVVAAVAGSEEPWATVLGTVGGHPAGGRLRPVCRLLADIGASI